MSALALVTVDGGLDLVVVVERADGVLVELVSGAVLDLVSVVAVDGLPA